MYILVTFVFVCLCDFSFSVNITREDVLNATANSGNGITAKVVAKSLKESTTSDLLPAATHHHYKEEVSFVSSM